MGSPYAEGVAADGHFASGACIWQGRLVLMGQRPWGSRRVSYQPHTDEPPKPAPCTANQHGESLHREDAQAEGWVSRALSQRPIENDSPADTERTGIRRRTQCAAANGMSVWRRAKRCGDAGETIAAAVRSAMAMIVSVGL